MFVGAPLAALRPHGEIITCGKMSSEKPLIYLILGAAGSGRRAVVADLVAGGLGEGDRALVLLSAAEPAGESDARLGAARPWQWDDRRHESPAFDGATHVFWVADGRRNPVDQIE